MWQLVAALRAALSGTHDVVVYEPGESMQDAMRKHQFAAAVVGPHGAGFSNLLFCPEGIPVVEIHPQQPNVVSESFNACHAATAVALGLPYTALFGDGSWEAPFTAPVPEVVDAVLAALRGP